MVTKAKRIIPRELATKVSSGLVGMAEQKWMFVYPFTALAVWMLFGPIGGRVDHNGTRYLFGAIVYPGLAALCLILFPLVPYRGNPKRYAGGGTKPIDASDPVAMRLVEIFRSREAKRVVVRIAIKLSGILLGSMLVAILVFRHSLSWSLYSFWFIPGMLGATLSCWLVISVEYLEWGFNAWAKEYHDQKHATSSSYE